MVLPLNPSIVGSFEILVGILVDRPDLTNYLLRWLPFAILGNMVGGILFVAGIHNVQPSTARRDLDGRPPPRHFP